MNEVFLPNALIEETEATTKRRGFFRVALIFLLVYFIASMIMSTILTGPMMVAIFTDEAVSEALGGAFSGEITDPDEFAQDYTDALLSVVERLTTNMPAWLNLAQLFATVATIITVLFYCVKIEKRRMFTLGFCKKGALAEYAVGLIIGLLMFSAAYLTIILNGELQFVGFNRDASFGLIILFFLGFVVQGASEEILLRSYFFISGSASANVPIGVFVSSALFACMHISNPGISFMAIVNLFLFGVFAALYFLRRGSIWGICAIHTVWNFAQGNIFGCKVSGMNMGESLFTSAETYGGTLWSGGSFGPEGGIGVTIVLTIGIVILTLMKNKNVDGGFVRKEEEFISA